METYPKYDLLIARLGDVKLSQCPLDIVCTPNSIQRVTKLDHEGITHGLDLPPLVSVENRSQQSPLFSRQNQREGLVSLTQGGVAGHVGEHDCSESALAL